MTETQAHLKGALTSLDLKYLRPDPEYQLDDLASRKLHLSGGVISMTPLKGQRGIKGNRKKEGELTCLKINYLKGI